MRVDLPDAQHVTLADAGHTVHVDQPATFARVLRTFVVVSPGGHSPNLTSLPRNLETN
jgi:hypothetical protein